jgi:phage gpG-like protein
MSKVDISDFTRKLDALSDSYRKLPNEIAATAVNFSKERFRDQAWLDKTKENWKPRARRRAGSSKKSQTLLVNTGRLKRGMRKISATQDSVIIGNDVPYAQIQNDGGVIEGTATVNEYTKREYQRKRKGRKETVRSHKVGSHTRKMKIKIPSRRFIGNSYTLERRLYLLIASRFAKALKQ